MNFIEFTYLLILLQSVFPLRALGQCLNAARFLLHDISLGYIKLWAFLYQEAVTYGLNFTLI